MSCPRRLQMRVLLRTALESDDGRVKIARVDAFRVPDRVDRLERNLPVLEICDNLWFQISRIDGEDDIPLKAALP